MDPVGNMSDWHFLFRPTRKERRKDASAHVSVQAADAIDRPAASDSQVGHVEELRRVVRILAAERQLLIKTQFRPARTARW
jgi:hypothetical protein